MDKTEILKRFINYETAIVKFFRELELKPNQCQLIRAFVLLSKGELIFEASFKDLGDVISKKGEGSRSDTNAKNAFNVLKTWQELHKIELIRVVTPGHTFIDNEGIKNFVKTKYEFVALEELVKVLYSDSDDLNSVIEESLKEIKTKFIPIERKRKYHPLENYRRAKNSIFTYIKNVFKFSKEAGLNPLTICEEVLTKSQKIVYEMKNDWDEEQNLDNYLKRFEDLLEPVWEFGESSRNS